ncbi:DAZ-associated protein 2-like [Pollicipes pollicipes]|uniref:DAZ-associated protein 2-like n=1 Tax=Pollicipes pollicipes TaxID=41117 RepID=UPI001885976D|nr:DAZ-associated protein 2-like [Pollicipes pollicipes]XP_037082990.1 DAZ-associated protein 2-like [Pollicipes pollicipes]XP_037082991.1 DAZ-associated protein 2-like [Pollicipes pollicipes]XP_037082992.1 DAZ-associated protein 2-like [Pollicipes pollicipes]XP_037082993.1 DAZ-associated protein 2-like [Pollicipes pollicipes]XP_037082994.1 DAZ-associated protein 2-like [Pollicipes pollicipes]
MSHKKGIPGGSPYPVQAPGTYPTAPPAYSPVNYAAFPQQVASQGGAWGQPPPPYSAAPSYGQPPAGYSYGQPLPAGSGPPQWAGQPAMVMAPGQYPPPGVQMGPGTEVHVPGAFNAGARFDGHAQPRIPPPPPGVAPNMAQLAAMSGARVVTSQQKSDKWVGGAGGGAVFW